MDALIYEPSGRGPSRPLGSRLEDLPQVFETCAGCRICADYCPLFVDLFALFKERAAGGPPGLVRAAAAGLLDGCYFCGRCEASCPLDFKIETLAWERLQEQRGSGPVPAPIRRGADVEWALRWSRRLGGLFSALLALTLVRRLLGRLAGIALGAPLPRVEGPSLRKWFASRAAPKEPAGKVALFAGCLGGNCHPEEGRALAEILERSGFEVRLVDSGCCGLPAFAAGLAGEARARLAGALGAMAPLVDEGFEVVVASSPCASMFQRRAVALLGEGYEELARVLPHVHESCQYLWGLYEAGQLARPVREVSGTAFYHAPCASRNLGSDAAAMRLLRQIPGLDLVRLDSGCCGLGGAWGLQEANYERARAFGEQHLAAPLREGGAGRVASECPQCRLQSAHLLPQTPTAHPAQLYREALGE